ncbi:hypothetical protein Pcac1_g9137 [Phytophthora cactorum]|nr:hypothetical protein Pcac1_g9137 [Phytophthora cactorum]
MATVVQIQDWRLSIARNARNGVQVDGEEAVAKPLSAHEQLGLLEIGEILLKYPAGLVQPFSRQELARLKKRFVQLIPAKDASRDLRLPLAVLLQMPELRAQPFVPFVIRLLLAREVKESSLNTSSGIENIDEEMVSFSAFVTTLAVFSVKQPLELKRRVLFDIYDQGNKGCVTVDDFLRIVTTVSRSNAARPKALRQSLEIHLAPFVKQTSSGACGVPLGDFNQLIVDEEIVSTLTIAF